MPFAPKRRCPRCPNYVPCAVHGRQADRERGSSSERGYGWDWQIARDRFLRDNPLCVDCLPRVELATEAHHIRKVKDYPELRLEQSNLMALCKGCHAVRTRRGE